MAAFDLQSHGCGPSPTRKLGGSSFELLPSLRVGLGKRLHCHIDRHVPRCLDDDSYDPAFSPLRRRTLHRLGRTRAAGSRRLQADRGRLAPASCRCLDDQLLEILAAAYQVRRRYWNNSVQLYFLMNAKSGLCPEDCNYCSQSSVSEAEIPKYNLLSREKLMAGAKAAAERNSGTYCIVISAVALASANILRGRNHRARDQAAIWSECLCLPRSAYTGTSSAACGGGR